MDSQETKTSSRPGRTRPTLKIVVAAAILLLIAACGLGFFFNRGRIADFIAARAFSPSSEIEQVEKSIELTGRGNSVFYASHPVLQNRDDFNESCNSHDATISVLGCYTNGTIYLYNIQDSELAGVVESTAAHELLHAAWGRMSDSEKSEISNQIKSVYDDEKYHDLLSEDIDIYEDDELIEELHSRIGTEIADLPEALENHYAKYFKNQDNIVKFYDSYIAPFRELSMETTVMAEELEAMKDEIEAKTAAYHQGENIPLDEINDLIKEHNVLVEEYNANILRGRALEGAINSNRQEEEIIEEVSE